MKLRDIIKMNGPNDGTRSLFESILPNELLAALKDWSTQMPAPVLIGGIALSFYAKPRYTEDLDYLFVSEADVPEEVTGFKRVREHAFLHNKTHVEIEVLTPEFLKISPALVNKVYGTAVPNSGVNIASAQGLIALKLQRAELQDQADVVALIKATGVGIDGWEEFLTDEQIEMFAHLQTVAEKEKGRV